MAEASQEAPKMDKSEINLKPAYPIFDGKDYGVWRIKIKSLLIARGLAEPLRAKPRAPFGTKASWDAWNQAYDEAEQKTLAILFNSLSDDQLKLVMTCEKPHEVWERLKALHKQRSQANRLTLQQQFYDLKQGATEGSQQFIARADYLYSQLEEVQALGRCESVLVDRIVCGLKPIYRAFVSTWMNLDQAQHTKMELIARLSAEDQLIARYVEKDDASVAMSAGTKSTGRAEQSAKKMTCYFCDEEGHIVRDCPAKKRYKEEKGGSGVRGAASAV